MMRQQKKPARSWKDEANVYYLEWDTFGLFAVAGMSSSGKSSTSRFILSQLALNDTGLVICDGHGRAGLQSLASTIEPLSPAFLYPVAVDPVDILESVRYIESIMRRRLNRQEPIEQKIAFVIDEFTSLMIRLSQENPEQAREITRLLLLISQEARKTNVRGFLLGHNWSANFLGNAAIRNNINSKLLLKLSANETKLFIAAPTSKLLRDISNLKAGEGYLMTMTMEPTKVYIPYVVNDDLKAIENLIPDIRNKYNEDFEEMKEKITKPIFRPPMFIESSNDYVKPKFTLDDVYKIIIDNRKNGIGKTKTIYQIWGVKQGGSNVYQSASKLYDAIIRKHIDEFGENSLRQP